MKEFDLIRNYFTEQIVKRKDVFLGIGDDCALLTPPERQYLAVTTDTLVAGVHFPENTPAKAVGHKAVAVNLSDLAAMGAEPCWISVALTIPEADEDWVGEFCQGMFELCEYYNVQLVGGDTTQGPLSITITAQGTVPYDKQITRSGAKTGDWLYVTGEIGDAALALQHYYQQIELPEDVLALVQKQLDYPVPCVLVGQALRGYASSAIDLSDGLLADLRHLCESSNVGVNLVLDQLPISNALYDSLGAEKAIELALQGGDDYQLLFTVSEDNKVGMETALADIGETITCIGQLNLSGKITTTLNSQPTQINAKGFEHFDSDQ
ncbi:thiamine-monophosphate kinase [Thalassotalea insulae]|uniref:Thiamine-monophosphate kinase n=1 Tax=Thalassotalea insulae TaxID=2056778 RepID=A0ABQ6GSE5_9GAMM|nr:thiamine-phosphate kinase [Thalassotalea insulae]GLX77567.1 thiamine-monophosphate kinase [Thalassotalea insulae]